MPPIGDLPSCASGKGSRPDPRPHPGAASADRVFTRVIENSYVHRTTNAAFIQRSCDGVRDITSGIDIGKGFRKNHLSPLSSLNPWHMADGELFITSAV